MPIQEEVIPFLNNELLPLIREIRSALNRPDLGLFPVGALSATKENVSPAELLGGTWVAFGTGSDTLAGETVYLWVRTA